MRLPVAQRGSVILMDVLGYSLEEIGSVMDVSIATVKAALHRGRARLRELAREPDDVPLPVLGEPERSLLAAYVERFNARDFDAIRDMLADEVRLDLVAKLQRKGRTEVANYFDNYARLEDWRLIPGLVDGSPAVLVRNPSDPTGKVGYFIQSREYPRFSFRALRDRGRGAVDAGLISLRSPQPLNDQVIWSRHMEGKEALGCVRCDGRYCRVNRPGARTSWNSLLIIRWSLIKKFFFSENPFATPIRLSIAERWRRDSSFAARFRSQGLEEDRNEVAHVCWFAEQP
jgi:hypothetical protein